MIANRYKRVIYRDGSLINLGGLNGQVRGLSGFRDRKVLAALEDLLRTTSRNL